MESIHLSVGSKGADRYDQLVHTGAPDAANLEIAVKAGAMKSGRSGLVISWEAYIDGRLVRVQLTTSARAFLAAAAAVNGAVERSGG